MGLKKKELRTEADLTPKQKMFVEILVADHGSITQAEALQRAGYDCKDINTARSTASQLSFRTILNYQTDLPNPAIQNFS
jgi:hypothetical protein